MDFSLRMDFAVPRYVTAFYEYIGVVTGVAGVAFATPLFEEGWQEYFLPPQFLNDEK